MGSCEYTIDGGQPNKGGGGINNVMSIHWMAATQQGRSIAGPLLINCGKTRQLNIFSFSNDPAAVPMAAKKYAIGAGKPFSVTGPDAFGATGEIDITAWDMSHVAGSFQFTNNNKKFTGTFDIKCPSPENGVCK